MIKTCSSCGARIEDSSSSCPLCGTPVEATVEDPVQESPPEPAAPDVKPSEGVFCNQCGHANPAGSRFCSSCGAQLAQAAGTRGESTRPSTKNVSGKSPDKEALKEETSIGGRVGVIFGASLAVIVVVFLFNALGGDDSPVTAPAVASQAVAGRTSSDTPLPPGFAEQLQAIHAEADGLDGAPRVAKLREGVELLLTIGRYDHAATEQEAIAEITGEEEDWVLSGNHYYDWMEMTQGPDAPQFAKKAVAAYQRAIAINPDNLDARADMAWAYMSDPSNPMQGIQENAAVLEIDSLHIRANYNRGRMLLQIGRVDQALDQFRKVQRIVGDPSNRLYQAAGELIRSIEAGGLAPPN